MGVIAAEGFIALGRRTIGELAIGQLANGRRLAEETLFVIVTMTACVMDARSATLRTKIAPKQTGVRTWRRGVDWKSPVGHLMDGSLISGSCNCENVYDRVLRVVE